MCNCSYRANVLACTQGCFCLVHWICDHGNETHKYRFYPQILLKKIGVSLSEPHIDKFAVIFLYTRSKVKKQGEMPSIGTSVTDQVSVTMKYNKSGGGNGYSTTDVGLVHICSISKLQNVSSAIPSLNVTWLDQPYDHDPPILLENLGINVSSFTIHMDPLCNQLIC